MIETVFLDAGGVLVWPNWQRVADALRKRGIHANPAQLAALDPLARYEVDRAEVVAASTDQRRAWGFFDVVFAEAGIELNDEAMAALDELQAYHRDENLWEISPDYVIPTLRRLRADGYTLVVLSNANGKLHHLFERIGLAPYFDVMLDSSVEQVEKPDRRFFELALARSGGRAETTVHVGDLYHVDVAGARNAGLAAVLVDEADLRKDADCPRIRSIAELPELLAQQQSQP
ncbi:MAG TPA: HAD family hydrolase [Thermoanaerobaculia bacterium]|nr:HAD family hydrolase [Thermoanaerobaculia bacterium]